jgi:hypothetical protein
VNRFAVLAGLGASAAGAFLLSRARAIAEEEGRPLADVLIQLPGRLAGDVSTIGDDLREAADEGKFAADDAAREFDEVIEDP